jgi:hypothetical protein
VTKTAATGVRRLCEPGTESDDIRIDPEFEGLIPPLSRGELADLHRGLDTEGCRDALVVWKGEGILIDGHNRIRYCREKGYPFGVVEREFADREAVKAYIVREQLGRRNLSPAAESYLRGKRYLAEKQSHGGSRSKAGSTDQADRLETAERLGEEFQVGEATIRRDGMFAEAVDAVVVQCGPEARNLILSRDSGLTRGGVRRLARLAPEAQRKFLDELQVKGKPPRKARQKKGARMSVPTKPKALVRILLARLAAEDIAEVLQGLAEAVEKRRAGRMAEGNGRQTAGHGSAAERNGRRARRGGRKQSGQGGLGQG